MNIVGNDQDHFTFVPAGGRPRRVSVFVCLPVILGCAVLGSILGVTHPLRSIFTGEHRAEQPADPSLASIVLIENAPAAGPNSSSAGSPVQAERPESVGAHSVSTHAQSPTTPAVALVSTGSVDRPSSPGVSENTALIAPEGPQASTTRLTGQSRIVRAKKLRRTLGRRARSSKPKTSELELLFAPMFPKK
jgi:hypothetical protein